MKHSKNTIRFFETFTSRVAEVAYKEVRDPLNQIQWPASSDELIFVLTDRIVPYVCERVVGRAVIDWCLDVSDEELVDAVRHVVFRLDANTLVK